MGTPGSASSFWKDVFFLHVGALADAFDGCGQHLVIPITDDTGNACDWRAAALQRVRAAHPSLMPLLMRLRCTLNGKEVGAVCRPGDLGGGGGAVHSHCHHTVHSRGCVSSLGDPNVRVNRCGSGCRPDDLFGQQRYPLCVLETEHLIALIRGPRLCQAILA